MKKNSIVFTLLLAFLYIVLSSDIDGAAHHGHGNLTGSPTGGTAHCQTSSCHGANKAQTLVTLQVLDTSTMMPITVYNALQTYLVTIDGNDTAVTTSLPGFGFMASAVLGNHTQAGTYTIPSALTGKIHTYPCGVTTVVENSLVLPATASGVNKYSTQFYWTAPPVASDSVSFYSVLNAVNGNGSSSGDYPNASPVVTIYENPATATCGIPTGLAHTAISQTSVLLNWSAVPGAVSYKVQYRATGAITWSTTNATTTSVTVTGLTPATTYEFGVQTVCSGGAGNFTATTDTATTTAPSGVNSIAGAAYDFYIHPNPSSSGNFTLTYSLANAEIVRISVYDVAGRKILQLVNNETQSAGRHEYVPVICEQGIYFVEFTAGNQTVVKRISKL